MKNKKTFKKIIAVAALTLAATLSVSAVGCFAVNGKDGANGKDLNIYDIYNAAKTESGNSALTFDEFLKEYLSYDSDELKEQTSLQSAINRSLMASVSILAGFRESAATSASTTYSGSGIIIDIDKENGNMIVMTNCHVVYSGKAAAVTGQDGYSDTIGVWLYGSEYTDSGKIDATIMATSKSYDVALLKIAGSDVVRNSHAIKAEWAAGEESYLGETVYAIGNANGNKMSANVGYISKDIEEVTVNIGSDSRQEKYDYQVLRTSTPINSGNSGGGLFNNSGELVGLVNSKSMASADSVGLGYALTASSTKRVVMRMLSEYDGTNEFHGINTVSHGIVLRSDGAAYTTGLNADGKAEIHEDVVVAAASGKSIKLKGGDVIKHIKITRTVSGVPVTVDEADMNRLHNFEDIMISVMPEDEVTFTLQRGDGEVTEVVSYTQFEQRDAKNRNRY